jgi:hypothetical protein
MTMIFVDARLVAGPADLAEPLRHLESSGYRLVLVDGETEGQRYGLPTVHELPHEPGAWFLAADPGRCAHAKTLALRSILVGPHRETRGLPERCDMEARDLADAALTILATEAMPGRGGRR